MKRFLCILLAITLCCLCSCGKTDSTENDGSEVYALVNSEEITKSEYEYFESRNKAAVLGDYLEKYSAEYSDDFWDTSFDGKTPRQTLEEEALKDAVVAKLKLMLMRDYKIYDDISYDGLYNKAVKFNSQHENTENTVGIKSIDLSQFYTYYISTGEMQLREELAKDLIKPSEEEISRYADSISTTLEDDEKKDAESIASSQLIKQKYEQYIEKLYENAKIEVK